MTRTFRHALTAGLTLEIAVDGTHTRIHQSTHLRLVSSLVHDLWVLDFRNGVRFLSDANKHNVVSKTKKNTFKDAKMWSRTISSGERIPN
jgi:hypothetical protein